MIKPLGFYIVIEIPPVEEISEGGIILPGELTKKEQASTQTGIVKAIGPTAFIDWAGCTQEGKTPAECWGIALDDKVEFRKFEGMTSAEDDTLRYIPDSHIVGLVE